MKCLKCQNKSDLDRLVVDMPTGSVLGSLCESCLKTRLIPVFQDDIWHKDSGCSVCAEDPTYHLPIIECLIEYSDDRQAEVEYGITDSTVRLCREHLEEILTTKPEAQHVSEAVVSQ